jgi:hypothetical protein
MNIAIILFACERFLGIWNIPWRKMLMRTELQWHPGSFDHGQVDCDHFLNLSITSFEYKKNTQGRLSLETNSPEEEFIDENFRKISRFFTNNILR